MKKKKRSNQEKLMIVLEGLKNTVPLAQLCSGHGITQAQYYSWRDRLVKDGGVVFGHGGPDKEQERLRRRRCDRSSPGEPPAPEPAAHRDPRGS